MHLPQSLIPFFFFFFQVGDSGQERRRPQQLLANQAKAERCQRERVNFLAPIRQAYRHRWLTLSNIASSDPIKCGEVVRLFHLSTRRNLHSHLFQSPLSNNQEVSAFGENGEGDDGDNWIVDCDEEYWQRDEPVRLRHEATKRYLHITGDAYGRPIHGQLEVSCYSHPNQLNLWRVHEGVYIKQSAPNSSTSSSDEGHTEL